MLLETSFDPETHQSLTRCGGGSARRKAEGSNHHGPCYPHVNGRGCWCGNKQRPAHAIPSAVLREFVGVVDSDGDIDPLRDIPKSERQKRKDKLRKVREKDAAIDARKRKKDGDFEVIDDAQHEVITEAMKKKQELIRAGT